jgi:hypothetical protein
MLIHCTIRLIQKHRTPLPKVLQFLKELAPLTPGKRKQYISLVSC